MLQSAKVLCTIHGMSPRHGLLSHFGNECADRVPGLIQEPIDWQRLGPFLLRNEKVRQSVFKHVYLRLENVTRKHPGADITILAHSYGTLAFVEALRMMIVGFRSRTVVFTCSVVKHDFFWGGWISGGTISEVLNIVRPFDWRVNQSHWIGGGYSGTKGFDSGTVNHYKPGGHSSFYPDDVEDVSTIILGNSQSIQATGYQKWVSTLSRKARFLYSIGRAVKILR